jgi:transcriptional regulator with XRE-family HTH domain
MLSLARFSQKEMYAMQAPKTFGQVIRQGRRAKGMTQQQLCMMIVTDSDKPITNSYLSEIEHDFRTPRSHKTIRSIAEAIGEDPDYLLFLAGKVPDDIRGMVADRETIIRALAAFRKTIASNGEIS